MGRRKINFKAWILIFLFFLTVAIWSVYFKEPDNSLQVILLDVGQGDAVLIEKGSWQVLIDGGPDNKIVEKLSKYMPLEDRKIEEVILTHPHADHVTGLGGIISRYEIGKINYNGLNYNSKIYESFLQKTKEKNIPVSVPKIGEEEKIFDKGVIKFLWPGENASTYSDNLNNTSEVFKFTYGNFSALFSGDAETEVWQEIEKNNLSDISNLVYFKVPHHGSKNGVDDILANIIKPKISTISCGKNNQFGFPHKEATEALIKAGSDIYRTDQNGDIVLKTDGEKWKVK
ncbi:MAG: competence protein ComEC [Candidatus Berkelbacteria bacterium Athens1014_28]|uniref:Competence protein ComEC n=1 Tax=Candidatus Berkelbacteria bacterium Athens1014_28 TaxID=2017145 RepID=A0A554LKR0_9BACT|nr:MAG: competence protein ComEC [Candidatus Berkelbacteria bacterium Athens1014_28]